MKKAVVTSLRMKELDQKTCDIKNISPYNLMKIAGLEIYQYLKSKIKKHNKITIISGIGNNGGDSLVLAKHLFNNGYKIDVFIVGDLKNQSIENKEAYLNLIELGLNIKSLVDNTNLDIFNKGLSSTDIIIDGIFGIGLVRVVKGIFKEVINLINNSKKHIYSIDIPSGINSDNGLISGIAVKANETLIIEHYKVGNLLEDALDYHGISTLLKIGIVEDEETISYLLEKSNIIKIKQRLHNSHKYNYGAILTIAGSKGLMGAGILTAYSSLRAGGGLAYLMYNDLDKEYITSPYPEIMIDTYLNIQDIKTALNKKTSIIFGPGLGRNRDINYEILKVILNSNIPTIIDADGIYYLKRFLSKDYKNKNITITPHHGELSMLLDIETNIIKKDPLKYIKDITNKYDINIILKGPCSIIATKEEIYYSTLGNPGMASAGSGDVLSGIIGSFISRDYSLIESLKLSVYIHSLASKYAFLEKGIESMTASDIMSNIPKVIKE